MRGASCSEKVAKLVEDDRAQASGDRQEKEVGGDDTALVLGFDGGLHHSDRWCHEAL